MFWLLIRQDINLTPWNIVMYLLFNQYVQYEDVYVRICLLYTSDAADE